MLFVYFYLREHIWFRWAEMIYSRDAQDDDKYHKEKYAFYRGYLSLYTS